MTEPLKVDDGQVVSMDYIFKSMERSLILLKAVNLCSSFKAWGISSPAWKMNYTI